LPKKFPLGQQIWLRGHWLLDLHPNQRWSTTTPLLSRQLPPLPQHADGALQPIVIGWSLEDGLVWQHALVVRSQEACDGPHPI
jgi:hypothetical protein